MGMLVCDSYNVRGGVTGDGSKDAPKSVKKKSERKNVSLELGSYQFSSREESGIYRGSNRDFNERSNFGSDKESAILMRDNS